MRVMIRPTHWRNSWKLPRLMSQGLWYPKPKNYDTSFRQELGKSNTLGPRAIAFVTVGLPKILNTRRHFLLLLAAVCCHHPLQLETKDHNSC
jgi:hypothetical protein